MRRTQFEARLLMGLLILGLALVTLVGCTDAAAKAATPRDGIQYGDAAALGNGSVRTYIEYDNGAPVTLGVELSEAVMAGLPGDRPVHEQALLLPIGNPTPFQHVMLQWNPGGHEPPGLYDLPHFDFHFYTVPPDTRLAITPDDPQFEAKAANVPSPEYVPAGYVMPAPVAIPTMGVHWIDPTSPEFNGKQFTHTFLFGSWNGQMIFAEPMISRAFLEQKQTLVQPVPVASKHARAGYYPTSYTIRWVPESRVWRVALTGLTRHD